MSKYSHDYKLSINSLDGEHKVVPFFSQNRPFFHTYPSAKVFKNGS